MRTIRFTLLMLIVTLLCSCRQNLFMQRKYTKGIYFNPSKDISEPVARHIPGKAYACAAKAAAPEKAEPVLLETAMVSEKKQAQLKDTIIIKKGPRETTKIRRRGGLALVTITLNQDSQVVKTKIVERTDSAKITTVLGPKNEIISKTVKRPLTRKEQKMRDLISLRTWAYKAGKHYWLPFVGIVFTAIAKHKCQRAGKLYPEEDIEALGKDIKHAWRSSLLWFVPGTLILCTALAILLASVIALLAGCIYLLAVAGLIA